MSNSNHSRRVSSGEWDPYDLPENYYGPTTNPKLSSSKFSRVRTMSMTDPGILGRRKVFVESLDDEEPDEPDRLGGVDDLDHFFVEFKRPMDVLKEQSVENLPSELPNELLRSSPAPDLNVAALEPPNPPVLHHASTSTSLRRPLIVPLYGDLSNESLVGNSNTTEEKLIPDVVDKHLKDALHETAPKLSRKTHQRRASLDTSLLEKNRRFYISDIDGTLQELLRNEDTDHNCQITIEDTGPKVLNLGTVNSNGYKQSPISGTYMLSNLLQELTIAKRLGRTQMILDERRLNENPVDRLRRLITTQFWKSLTRRINTENIIDMAKDTKIKEEVVDDHGKIVENSTSYRIYVPHERLDQYEFFKTAQLAHKDVYLDVQILPEIIDAEYIMSINKKPGLLSLALHTRTSEDGSPELIFQPYVVPGGRFNELYGWDSYMETLGLLVTAGENIEHLRLARGMAENFIYEIRYYGKILNANRLYYLGRSQPPFLTDMAIKIHAKTLELAPDRKGEADDFLHRAIQAAIKEYETIWTSEPRLDLKTGLSCYHPIGKGIPPETEATHFDALLDPYAKKHGISKQEFIEQYNSLKIKEPKLDEYFLHDRAVRESGHDTSYRLEGKCAYLATVDLNSLLYKYETDIAEYIETVHDGKLTALYSKQEHSSDTWSERAKKRKQNVDKYLWDEKTGAYFDYNVHEEKPNQYESATMFWPLWSKMASQSQADLIVAKSLPKLEKYGGLASGTLELRGKVGLTRPLRQWDFPFGWAPQQILAWVGFSQYGYEGVTRRLAYRWLYLMTQAFVDFNGIVVEKYDVTQRIAPHKVEAEYGNQGLGFKGVATEGFGWVNALYVFGLTFLPLHAKRNLGTLTDPDVFLKNLNELQKESYSSNRLA